jgi:UDPglucose 6-dehydrogenase/GDP-mannose 6-dehydrogenase
MKLGIIGAGYVGLTTGICLANLNHKIVIYDKNNEKSEKIKNKKMPFYEKGLQPILEKTISSGNLKVADNVDYVVKNTDGSFICVGTPTKADNSIDLSQVLDAIKFLARSIKNNQKKDYTIIIRSTIVPNTTKQKILPLLQEILDKISFGLCVIPEFLREGVAFEDFMNPDKIVIGGIDEKSTNFAGKIFEHFKMSAKIIKTNPETAELIKYTNNSFFSMLISFSNEIANIAEKISGVDPFEVLKALIYDRRITTKLNGKYIVPALESYLVPGCGFGGSCFPKDVKAILNYANSQNVNAPLLDAILKINEERPSKMISLAESILGSLKNKKITILGLTFKPETDDLRSSPSLEAIKILLEKGAKISAYDPIVNENSNQNFFPQGLKMCSSIEESLMESDLVLVFTKWSEFKSLDGNFLKKFMKKPLIIDGRGFLEKEQFQDGTYFKIGFNR